MVERALPFVTVYSGVAEINVLDAAPEVVAALPGMTPAKLDAFLSQRESLPPDNPEFVLGALGGRQVGATVAGSDAYRIRMRIILPDGRHSRPEAIIMILGPGEKEAYRVFAWRDEIDPGTGGAQRAGRTMSILERNCSGVLPVDRCRRPCGERAAREHQTGPPHRGRGR